MSENKNDSFFAEEYEEAPETIRFVDEEVAGIADIIPERAARPDALPQPEEYVSQKVERWNPGKVGKKKRKRQKTELPFSPLRLGFGILAVAVMLGIGWVFYSMFALVLGSAS